MTSHDSNKGSKRFPSRVRRFLGLGVLSGVMSSMLFAAPADLQAEEPGGDKEAVRYTRKSGKVKTKAKLDTKFKKQKKAAEAAKRKQERLDAQNMMSAEDFAKRKAAVTRAVSDKQIDMLKRLIQSTERSDPELPELLFRLADLYLEKKAYFERQAGALYEQIYDAKEKRNKAKAQQLRQKQKRFQQQEKKASGDAVKIYKVMVSDPSMSKYKRMDEALYFYAFELGNLKREAEMKEAYLRLIREYPQSQFIPHAYLSFADYYFGKNQIADALKLYQKIVTAYKDSPVYAYALYKMGWCYLNPIGTAEPQYAKSLQKFVQTIEATLQGRAGSEANAKQLRRDARRDLVKAYVHAGKPSRSWEFFTKVGNGPKKEENMSRKMMELLATAYFGEGMYIESTATYKRLQQLFEADQKVCEWQARIVVNALATDDKQIQWKETDRLGQYWLQYKDGKHPKPIKRKCRNEALDTMKQMATVWHDEAEKTRRPETYDLAEKAYRAFLQVFPKDKDSYELHYYYAEIIWAQASNLYNTKNKATREEGRKKFLEAHDEFLRVLEHDPKGKFTKDCAYAQMLAMKNYLEYDETGGRAKACKTNTEGVCVYREKKKKKKAKANKQGEGTVDAAADFPESEYTEDESKMIGAYDVYQKYVQNPKDKELPKIMYHRLKLMMIHNKFKEARPLAETVVKKFDGSIYAAWASEMLFDMLTVTWLDKNNTPQQTVDASDDLEKWSKQIQKMKVWRHKEADRVRDAVPMLLAGIGWKKGMAYLEQGRQGDPGGYVRCAEQFVSVFNEHEDHDKADTLLFNAANCYEAAYLMGQTIRMRSILLDKFPSSGHAKEVLLKLAQNYRAIAYFDKSAERYEAYAGKYPKDKESREALQNAYLFRLGLGENEKAQTNLSKYEAVYKRKDPKVAAKIFWSKSALLNTDKERMDHALAYLKTYGKSGGVDRRMVAEALIGQIQWRQSCEKELLYDSCITIQRQKATAGEEQRQKARALRRKTKGKGKKKKKKYRPPKYCGNPTQGLITVHNRSKKKADAAQKRFSAVLKLKGKKVNIPAEDTQRAEDYKNAMGMAMVYTADRKYEEYLTVLMPEGLDFMVEEWKKDAGLEKWENEYKEQVKRRDESIKKYQTYEEKKTKLAAELVERYAKVKDTKSPAWILASAGRSAIVWQNYADQLYRAPVPRGFVSEEQYYAYCDELADRATPFQAKADEAFTYCLQRSTEFEFFNEFSRMCEEELQQTKPDKYPATNELFGVSIYTNSRLDRVPVQTNLEGETPTRGKKKAEKKDEGEKDEKSADAAGY